MALKTFVKISNVTNLSDARYCSGMMVDVLGFNIDPSTDSFLNKEDFTEISDWVAGVRLAGEFYEASLEQIRTCLQSYPVDMVEIDRQDFVEKIQLLGKPIIFRVTIREEADLKQLKGRLSYLDELVECVTIKCTNEALYEQIDAEIGYYNGNVRLLKGYGIDPDEKLGKFPGLELQATEEERPGYKDYGKIMDVLEALEDDD